MLDWMGTQSTQRDLFHHAHGSAVHKRRSSKLERETREVLQSKAIALLTS